MKYFFDTEFFEDGKNIDLVSIGIVSEVGKTYYAVVHPQEPIRVSPNLWVIKNVLPKLYPNAETFCKWKSQIKQDILQFVGTDPRPEFWAYYGAYDWVVFCQLFGTMMDLPKQYPQYAMDIEQWRNLLGNPKLPEQAEDEKHNALNDALWTKKAWEFLNNYTSHNRMLNERGGM